MKYLFNLLMLSVLCLVMSLPAYAGGRRGGRGGGGGMFGNFPNQKPLVGDKAPDFKLEDTKGKKYKLSDFKGKKPVVLEFGALT